MLGILAALSLFWQQQTTLAAFVDTEHSKGTFTARTLAAISPTLDPSYSKIDASWNAAQDPWTTPQYSLDWSTSSSGTNPAEAYSGSGTAATLSTSGATPADTPQDFTDVASGATHACGIAGGDVYCWGYSPYGALGLGSTTTATRPTLVAGALAGEEVVEVSAGSNFTCVRTAALVVFCWGLGTSGQLGTGLSTSATTPQQVTTLSTVTSVSAGGAHACAVSEGKAYCWGAGTNYQLGNGAYGNRPSPTAVTATGVLAGRVVSSVSAGNIHSCAVADGRAFCWGNNGSGRLGNNTANNATAPVAVLASGALLGRTVSAVSAGDSHSCAIADGGAFCWGLNTNGRLGNSTATTSYVAVPVTTTVMSGTVTAISAGYAHSCAISSGHSYCWGLGSSGQLGVGNTASSTSPVLSTGAVASRALRTVSAGTNFTCATGYTPVACWGLGTSSQVGDGASTTRTSPVDVDLSGLTCAEAVRVGSECSLREGTNYYFRLGYSIGSWVAPNSSWVKGTTKTRGAVNPSLDSRTSSSITLTWPAPVEVGDSAIEYTVDRSLQPDGSNPKTIAVVSARSATDRGRLAPSAQYSKLSSGYYHSCGIVDGSLYCWGRNNAGQLGMGDYLDLNSPTRVSFFDGMSVTDVSVGQYHTCAIADDKAYCWGYNNYGQLGIGNATTQTSPVQVANQGSNVAVRVAAGQNHSCGIISDGSLWCWGYNNFGQLGVGNNTVSAVNYNPQQVLAGAMGTNAVTDVTGGTSHTCAIAGARAYCWGRSNYGQIGTTGTASYTAVAVNTSFGLGTKSVTAINAGFNHTCAIADSTAYCWGYNNYGQLGNGGNTNNYRTQAVTTNVMSGAVTAISGAPSSTCAVADGKAYCWGLGTSGQLGNSASGTSYVPVRVPASGSLQAKTAGVVGAGYQHSCGTFDGQLYCWGEGSFGRLADREVTDFNYPQAAALGPVCHGGGDLGDGTCGLSSATTYYYRVTYTIDGGNPKVGDWVGVSTSN